MKIESLTPSFIQLTDFTVLEASGGDAGAFLHRLSTNHITGLELGESCLTAFLDQKGRLVATAYVLRTGLDIFRVVVPYSTNQSLAQWLDQFLFTEDAIIKDATNDFSLAISIGNGKQGFRGPDFRFGHTTLQSSFLLLPHGKISLDLPSLEPIEFEALRVAGCVPLSLNEINSNFNPLQLGLANAIHWAKGCYIGQEVVSRLESKEKAVSTLVGGRAKSNQLAQINSGEAVHTENGPAGVVTSVAPMDLNDEANVLIVFKRAQPISVAVTDLSKVRIDIIQQHE